MLYCGLVSKPDSSKAWVLVNNPVRAEVTTKFLKQSLTNSHELKIDDSL